MKHIQLYEAFKKHLVGWVGPSFIHREQPIRDEFAKVKDELYKSFNLKSLKEDCQTYGINFYNLVKELVINKKIAFQCTWCYSSDFFEDFPHSKPHSIIGVCKDVIFENPRYHDSDLLVKIDNDDKWHTLFVRFNNPKSQPKFSVRIYNYTEGILIKKLEMLKNMEKYNI